jgi:hypothetical protein
MDLRDIGIRFPITDYLQSSGVDLERAGRRRRCRCPLPNHEDKDPSFYVGEFPDGGQWFKCWGCGESGGIVALRCLMEGKAKGAIIREMAGLMGISPNELERYAPVAYPEDIVVEWCQEDCLAEEVAVYARRYLGLCGGAPEEVDKVSRLYGRLDELLANGDMGGMVEVRSSLRDLLYDYSLKMNRIEREEDLGDERESIEEASGKEDEADR